ncbi:hypothetical protein SJ05684_b46090 (plasmid) [Sinorhizobium sojae CCBAU 05684]|uniref:TfuA-like core domain-containing protein n=1 Tax=Sinorhizobium sojae CCBAU 05684 TaxID=716928 RepID=A0A249PI50_9HYPH|nr:TfuA-like protein [Sinorhizobium sojae]ASY65591.1 hypothetical protein SJ05684_b46090 [Sinorhizobium sojae CCBAU 05684]
MKVVFVGPTVPDAAQMAGEAIVIRPPARQGDILRAARDGATAIGLVDGNFEHVAPVWHKEILFALSQGVAVLGAASMGALRAAECAVFGMVGIGAIYHQYAAGETADDSDVALLHAPEELGYLPLSLPLVNVRVTLRRFVERQTITAEHAAAIEHAAAKLFYKERTWSAITAGARLPPHADREALATALRTGYVDQKRKDALELLDALNLMSAADESRLRWTFNATSLWTRLHDRI